MRERLDLDARAPGRLDTPAGGPDTSPAASASDGECSAEDRESDDLSDDLSTEENVVGRRRSRLMLAFGKRSSAVSSRMEDIAGPADSGSRLAGEGSSDAVMAHSSILCFPSRRVTTRGRGRGPDREISAPRRGAFGWSESESQARAKTCETGACERLESFDGVSDSDTLFPHDVDGEDIPADRVETAMPRLQGVQTVRIDGRHGRDRRMVKNVSMQRDDWIEFATSGNRSRKQPWLARILSSSNVHESFHARIRKQDSVQREEDREASGVNRKVSRFWRFWPKRR